MTKLQKFRPVFDEDEIKFLYSAVVAEPAGFDRDRQRIKEQLIRKLAVLDTKINVGALTPSYQLKDWMTELGFTESDLPTLRKSCYDRRKNGEILSDREAELANTFAWENDLMTPAEKNAFELHMMEGKA